MHHTPLSRRQCLLWGSLGAATWLSGCAAPADTHQRTAAGFVRQAVGQAHVVAISDGISRRPLDAQFVRGTPLATVQAALAAQGLPTDYLDVPYTCFVLEVGGKRYLLDAGFGDNGPPGTGLLHQHMRAAGIDPASIDAVIISHMHGDHIHGLRRKDGTLVYPHAQVFVSAPEYHYWMSDGQFKVAPEAARAGFLNARRVFLGYPSSQLQLFTPGRAIAPHIHTQAAYGHSPGQAVVSLSAGAQRFTYLADVAHHPALFVRHPDWQVQFDMHPEAARHTRRQLLRALAQSRSWVGGYHFPMPGLGQLQAEGDGYLWRPLGA